MGAEAHGMIRNYIPQFKGDCIIEIGCGESSRELFDIAKQGNQKFIGVDPSRRHIKTWYDDPDFIYIDDMYGQDYLKEVFPSTGLKISAAYLDNFDWTWEPKLYREKQEPEWIHQQIMEYKAAGVEMNNVNSSVVHLQQVIEIEKYAADDCVVLFDDTWFDYHHDCFIGKGAGGVYYLLAKGWDIILKNKEYDTTFGPAIAIQKRGV